jgi:hypothetical protein
MPKLLHIRLKGFATNSSSSHSVIVAGSARTSMDGPELGGEFGWEHFLQSGYDEKMAYLGQALLSEISDEDDPKKSRAVKIVKDLLGVKCDPSGHIDHQSRMDIPKKMNNKVAMDFWKEFAIAMSKDSSVEICGGNDNGGDVDADAHPFWSEIYSRLSHYSTAFRVRKDGKVWTLFNARDGEKLHISLDDTKIIKDFKPRKPELVDLKITNKCLAGCDFCYQDSTKSGKHASFKSIERLINEFVKAEIFEIAIGGGEPTLHPDFRKILSYIKQHNMVPNFSTKNYQYFTDDNLRFLKHVIGSIGISVSTPDDAVQYMKILGKAIEHEMANRWSSSTIIMHYIIDQHPISNFIEILKVLTKHSTIFPRTSGNHHILLLGKKLGGRSVNTYVDNTGWSLFLQKYLEEGTYDISIDTLVANRYPIDLKSIDKKLYYLEEGRFSVYVDATTAKFGKASYGVPLVPYKEPKDILKAFKKWQPVIIK